MLIRALQVAKRERGQDEERSCERYKKEVAGAMGSKLQGTLSEKMRPRPRKVL